MSKYLWTSSFRRYVRGRTPAQISLSLYLCLCFLLPSTHHFYSLRSSSHRNIFMNSILLTESWDDKKKIIPTPPLTPYYLQLQSYWIISTLTFRFCWWSGQRHKIFICEGYEGLVPDIDKEREREICAGVLPRTYLRNEEVHKYLLTSPFWWINSTCFSSNV